MKASWAPAAPAIVSDQGESRTPMPYGHDVLSVACLPVPPLGHLFSGPCGNRTRLSSLRGWRPEPIDERAMLSVRRAGVEPAQPRRLAALQPVGLADAQPTHVLQVAQAGVEPADHEGLSFAALPVCVPCRFIQASSTGFEPAISCVTGRRALQAAPRGHDSFPVAQVGLEPTASLVLSQGGLPVAYRAVSVPRAGVEPATARV